MTTANKITIFRVVLIPVFLVLMYLRFPGICTGRSVCSCLRA